MQEPLRCQVPFDPSFNAPFQGAHERRLVPCSQVITRPGASECPEHTFPDVAWDLVMNTWRPVGLIESCRRVRASCK